MNRSVRKLWTIYFGVFVAASAVGGLVKLPSPVGSIALDSAPGYFLAAFVHPVLGGLVGAVGHLASAATAGFLLGDAHLWIALEMFFWCFAFGAMARAGKSLWWLGGGALVATILNGVVGPYLLYALGQIERHVALGVMVLLTLASAINIAIACAGVVLIERRGKAADTQQ